MKIMSEIQKENQTAIFMESKAEAKTLLTIVESAMAGKPLNKRSAAYKMAKEINDELPAF